MPNYLLTRDVLNVSVSCFTTYNTPDNPITINLLKWLKSTKYQAKIEALRLIEDKTERNAIKASLPAITPSAVFTYRQESSMVIGSHTRLIQFDIDQKDNQRIRNYADLKEQIRKLPFVAYCGLSASGKGYWGLVVIAYPERHNYHFDALKRVFAYYGIYIDTKPRNVASLRGYSYDSAPYIPEQVMPFELFDLPINPNPRSFSVMADGDTERKRVEVCIQEALKRGTYIGDNYEDWYEVGCSLANAFGEDGRDYFHHISQQYPNYKHGSTDKQFTACLQSNSQATLGTFFHLCQQQGIKWKELLPFSERAKLMRGNKLPSERRLGPSINSHVVQHHTHSNSIFKLDESKIKRLIVEPCDNYPAEWDAPNLPDALPTITAKSFHEFQCQHPAFKLLGLASLDAAL